MQRSSASPVMQSENIKSAQQTFPFRPSCSDKGLQNSVAGILVTVIKNSQDFLLKLLFKFYFLTNTVQPVQGNCFKGPSHHGILFQHLIEVVHRQRVQTTVRVCSDAGCPSSPRQQTNLCNKTQQERDGNVVEVSKLS